MSMFPGAGAQVYRNEAGEPLGWDYPSEPDCHDYPEGFYEDCEDTDDWCRQCSFGTATMVDPLSGDDVCADCATESHERLLTEQMREGWLS